MWMFEERIGEVWRSEESRKVGKVPALIILCVEISLSSHGSATSFQQIPDASKSCSIHNNKYCISSF